MTVNLPLICYVDKLSVSWVQKKYWKRFIFSWKKVFCYILLWSQSNVSTKLKNMHNDKLLCRVSLYLSYPMLASLSGSRNAAGILFWKYVQWFLPIFWVALPPWLRIWAQQISLLNNWKSTNRFSGKFIIPIRKNRRVGLQSFIWGFFVSRFVITEAKKPQWDP